MTMGVCIVTWKEARQEIKDNVGVGTDVNSKESRESNYRIVIFVLDNGYIIPKGRGRYMFVTWGMLKKCWEAMNKKQGEYDIKAFEDHYPEYPDCYVQTVHMIFKEAGLT